jgi:chromosome segregation ATPase
MEDIRNTRPWFWILVAALAAVAVVALVIAISASNESVDQKKLVNEATEQVKEEVSGLDQAVEAANEFQEESDQLAAKDRKRIKREVNAAVAGGEAELTKLKKRVASLESSVTDNASEDEKLRKSVSNLSAGQEDLEAEVVELEKRVNRLEKQGG